MLEAKDTLHWLETIGTTPVVEISVNIFKQS